MKLINALLVLVIFVASSSMCLPDHALLLPNLFKEAIKLKDYGISERDIIHYCSNAEDIINYIFRDVGNIESDEARVKNLNMVLSFKEVQKQLEADNAAVLRNRRFLTDPFHYEDLNIGIMPHRVLDSLQHGPPLDTPRKHKPNESGSSLALQLTDSASPKTRTWIPYLERYR